MESLALPFAMFIGPFSWSFVYVRHSARIGAAFVGPVRATTVLALAPPWVLYLVLASLGLAAVPVALWRRPPSPSGA